MLHKEKIERDLNNIDKLKKELTTYKTNPQHVEIIRNCAYIADKIALDLRRESIEASGCYIDNPNLIEHLDKDNNEYYVNKIWKDSVIFSVPPLLNFRVIERKKGEKNIKKFDYLGEILKSKIRQFILNGYESSSREKKVLFVFNVISTSTPDTFISDSDNRYYTTLINIIKQFFVADDSYQYLSYYIDTVKYGDKTKTVVLLVSEDDLNTAFVEINRNLYSLLEPETYEFKNLKLVDEDKNKKNNR